MSPPDHDSSAHRRSRPWLWLLLALAVGWAAAWTWLSSEREALRRHEGEKLAALVQTLDAIVGQQMIAIQGALQTVEAQRPGWRQPQQQGEAMLRTLARALPGVRALLVLDTQGQVLASSEPRLVGLDMSERPYYTTPRRRPQPGLLYVSPPFRSLLDERTVTLSRALFDAEHHFAGIVVAALNPAYFSLMLETAQPSAQTWSALAHQDGMLFALLPHDADWMSRNLLATPGSILEHHLASGQPASLQLMPAKLSQDLRLVAARTVQPAGLQADRQLIVAVGRSLPSVEGPWQRQRLSVGLVGVALSLFAAVALTLWQRRQRLIERLRRQQLRSERQAAAQLKAQAQHTQAILDHMVDGVITIDARGRIDSINPAACRMFGYAAAELLNQDVSLLMPQGDAARHDQYVSDYLRSGAARIIGVGRDVDGRRKDGQIFPMSLAVSRIDREGEPLFIGLTRDITERKRAEAAIEQLAFYDPLTGLPNRRLLLDRLNQALASSRRNGRHGALLFIDLDNFKSLNDTMGHGMGDRMLQAVAQRLRAALRSEDTVARWGGDEFVVLLQDLGQERQRAHLHAEAAAEKLLRVLGQPYLIDQHNHHSTPSIGIVVWNDASGGSEELLKHADHAMYEAKSAGRNRLAFFDPISQAAMAELISLEADLRQAVNYQQFELYYQAQVSADGRLLGAEALLRWPHPSRGFVSPAQFIPLAEQTGTINQIGEWVLQQACAQLNAWAHEPATAGLSLAVNLSAHQFRQKGFLSLMQQLLARTGVPTELLKLELTESALVDDVESVIGLMGELRRLGLRFSLDDFGTGYSSLAYLKRLPLDQLKIDQSFVRDLVSEPNARAIAHAVIQLGESLGLAVIAEGVETAEQRELLIGLGCHAFQGYFHARPMPAAAFAELARQWPTRAADKLGQ
ncbi:bifunctional diguanylate cyclase/phosphodiesterase [Roseateles aquae]|nr:EAL domain-containing protein [Paucibacter sp. APW11]